MNIVEVVSGIRGTEVVADATNGLALHVAGLRKGGIEGVLRFCTVHRHVRTQPFADKRFLPHFVIGCMVTAGRDTGSYGFELAAVEIADGGFVDWTQQLLGNRKERFLISGFGLELLFKMQQGIL
jgi:hypothetical protein